jgi:hypothetical protein
MEQLWGWAGFHLGGAAQPLYRSEQLTVAFQQRIEDQEM